MGDLPGLECAQVGATGAVAGDDDKKNRLCRPILYWDLPVDYLTAYMALLASDRARAAHPALAAWANRSRLNPLGRLNEWADDERVIATRALLKQVGAAAMANVPRLLAEANAQRAA